MCNPGLPDVVLFDKLVALLLLLAAAPVLFAQYFSKFDHTRSGFNPTGALGSYLVVGLKPDLQLQSQNWCHRERSVAIQLIYRGLFVLAGLPQAYGPRNNVMDAHFPERHQCVKVEIIN